MENTDYAAFGGYWDSAFTADALYSGDPVMGAAVGVQSAQAGYMPGDVTDAQQMATWTAPAAQQQGAPWYAGAVMYGISKAIDNAFPGSPTGSMGNIYPGSIGGTNGRTYTLRPQAQGGVVGSASVSAGGSPLLLLLLAAVAFAVLK